MSEKRRLEAVARQVHSSGSLGVRGEKRADDVVIIDAVRTPICKARTGALRDVPAEELLSAALAGVLARTKIDPGAVEDVVAGNVLAPGAGATLVRMAALHAGIPEGAGAMAVNRQCSSGLQAVASVAAAIRAGSISVGVGAGFESMSAHYGPQALAVGVSDRILAECATAADCLIPMGVTSENVAEQYSIDRRTQDAFALESCARALRAQKEGLFASEIVPVNGVSADEAIRSDVTADGLARLKPAFKPDGSTTAGNASKVCDGAAAVLLARRDSAERLGLRPRARLLSYRVVGVPPRTMGIGPALAIPAALSAAGVSASDVAVFELNEAFASQAAYCVRVLGLDATKVNPRGGAIALGHPLGATGARQVATLLPQLRPGDLGVVSMCVGTGMGAAAVLEAE